MFVSSEKDFNDHPHPIPGQIVHFKMVSVGPGTLEQTGRLGNKICDLVKSQSGFFIVGDNADEIRKAMHDLVDRFCNLREGKQ